MGWKRQNLVMPSEQMLKYFDIDTQHLLPFEDPEAVKKTVIHTRKTLGPGYVLGSVHNLQAAVPPENIAAMFTA